MKCWGIELRSTTCWAGNGPAHCTITSSQILILTGKEGTKWKSLPGNEGKKACQTRHMERQAREG